MTWKRVSNLSKCPICSKNDWCLIAHDRSAVICPRIDEGSSRYIEGSGYLHVLKWNDEWKDEEPAQVEKLPEHNEVLAIQARRWVSECEPEEVGELAGRLGVTAESLRLLNVGFMPQKDSWMFPMQRWQNRLVGIRLRPRTSNKKFTAKGSKNGLFIPNNLNIDEPVFITEGESDTAALLSCGLNTVGRVGCTGGSRLLANMLDKKKVVICLDRDGAGYKGGYQLSKYLSFYCKDIKIMTTPLKYNDMREWYRAEGQDNIRTTAERLLGEE